MKGVRTPHEFEVKDIPSSEVFEAVVAHSRRGVCAVLGMSTFLHEVNEH